MLSSIQKDDNEQNVGFSTFEDVSIRKPHLFNKVFDYLKLATVVFIRKLNSKSKHVRSSDLPINLLIH